MATVQLSRKVGIFPHKRKTVNILTIANSKKIVILIKTDSLRNKCTVNIGDAVKNSWY